MLNVHGGLICLYKQPFVERVQTSYFLSAPAQCPPAIPVVITSNPGKTEKQDHISFGREKDVLFSRFRCRLQACIAGRGHARGFLPSCNKTSFCHKPNTTLMLPGLPERLPSGARRPRYSSHNQRSVVLAVRSKGGYKGLPPKGPHIFSWHQ